MEAGGSCVLRVFKSGRRHAASSKEAVLVRCSKQKLVRWILEEVHVGRSQEEVLVRWKKEDLGTKGKRNR